LHSNPVYQLPVAGWSSPVARQAHNLKVAGSNPAPATNLFNALDEKPVAFENPCAAPVPQLKLSSTVLIV
jgi:hypothetical protein